MIALARYKERIMLFRVDRYASFLMFTILNFKGSTFLEGRNISYVCRMQSAALADTP